MKKTWEELLALDGVKVLASRKVKVRATRKHPGQKFRLDVVRCREPRAFIVVQSKKGVILNYSSYFTRREALADFRHDGATPELPSAVLALVDPAGATGGHHATA